MTTETCTLHEDCRETPALGRECFASTVAYTTKLAKLLGRLKKDAGASTIAQNYKGTGSQKFRRQLWVRFASGAVIDLWLERDRVKLGGVVTNAPPGSSTSLSTRTIPYAYHTPEHVAAEVAAVLRPWANPSREDDALFGRSRHRVRQSRRDPSKGYIVRRNASKKFKASDGDWYAGSGATGPRWVRSRSAAKQMSEREADALARVYGSSETARDASRPPPLPGAAVRTMARMLTQAGYAQPSTKAQRLAREGIGPHELAFRLKHDSRPPARSRARKRTRR